MQTPFWLRLNTTHILIATIAIAGIHALIGWQYALVVPLVYAYFLPSRAYLECTLQMILAWGILVVTSYTLAPAETARMLEAVVNIIARNAAHDMGWVMMVVSLLFAALLGLLSGMVGSSARLFLTRSH
ncbi:MAG: hypothetical protein JNN25_11445 [Candidatus Kapabacteria bacterium]|nr:hypothetical protein [Candidatus Kapabacteria bacterium]